MTRSVRIHVLTGIRKLRSLVKAGKTTMDRHGIISEALSLGSSAADSQPCSAKIKKNVVLDAEMIAWDKDRIGGVICRVYDNSVIHHHL